MNELEIILKDPFYMYIKRIYGELFAERSIPTILYSKELSAKGKKRKFDEIN
jgi:hypothetical protein